MGTPIQVEIPNLGEFETATTYRDAWFEDESASSRHDRRFVLSIVADDRPGILLAATEALARGLTLGGSGTGQVLRFSIDGSMSSATHGTFVAVLVVQPSVGTLVERAALDHLPDELITERLKARMQSALRNGETGAIVDADAMRYHATDIFTGRRFSEYRFGTPDIARLGAAAQRFANAVEQCGVPIAYLQFPYAWSERPDCRWLRIGVGLEPSVASSVPLDLAAVRIAESLQCAFEKYDPSTDGPSLGNRFRRIVDAGPPAVVYEEVLGDLDVVFVKGHARVGYVANMLGEATGLVVAGGSMAVLAGHTVATWLLRKPDSVEFLQRLRQSRRITASIPSEPRELRTALLPGHAQISEAERDEYWVCWRCAEQPGVLYSVLDEVRRYLAEVHHEGAPDLRPNVEQEVSRVLAEGKSCAGKVKLTVERLAGSPDICGELAERLENRLAFALEDWAPEREAWLTRPILVSRSEPGEDPWATLSLR